MIIDIHMIIDIDIIEIHILRNFAFCLGCL